MHRVARKDYTDELTKNHPEEDTLYLLLVGSSVSSLACLLRAHARELTEEPTRRRYKVTVWGDDSG